MGGRIKEEDLARLFEIGWRGEPERGTRDAGAGLGLAIARGVIESHSGSISVANVDGGCRFDVELPARDPACPVPMAIRWQLLPTGSKWDSRALI